MERDGCTVGANVGGAVESVRGVFPEQELLGLNLARDVSLIDVVAQHQADVLLFAQGESSGSGFLEGLASRQPVDVFARLGSEESNAPVGGKPADRQMAIELAFCALDEALKDVAGHSAAFSIGGRSAPRRPRRRRGWQKGWDSNPSSSPPARVVLLPSQLN